jgi:hypothetical protein
MGGATKDILSEEPLCTQPASEVTATIAEIPAIRHDLTPEIHCIFIIPP